MVVLEGVGAQLDLRCLRGLQCDEGIVVEGVFRCERELVVGVDVAGYHRGIGEPFNPGLEHDFFPAAGLAGAPVAGVAHLHGNGYREGVAIGILVVRVHDRVEVRVCAVDIFLGEVYPGVQRAGYGPGIDVGIDAVVELFVEGVVVGELEAVEQRVAYGIHPGCGECVVEEDVVDRVDVGFGVEAVPEGARDFFAEHVGEGIDVHFGGVLAILAVCSVYAVGTGTGAERDCESRCDCQFREKLFQHFILLLFFCLYAIYDFFAFMATRL